MSSNKRLIAEILSNGKVIMTIDKNLLDAEFGALDRGNISDVVDWGIYANRGSISFIDNIGYFNNDSANSTKLKNHIVRFYLKRTEETPIATFYVDSIDFDEENRQVDLQLVGKIIDLQKKPSAAYGRISYAFSEKSALYLMGLDGGVNAESFAEYPFQYPSYGITVGENETFLRNSIIYCPYLPSEKAWDRYTKICQATMTRIVEDEYGNPIITQSNLKRTPIIVNPNNIIGISNQTFVRIPNTSIDVTNRVKYTKKKVEQISKHFDISYDVDGLPISISNCEYSFGSNNTATIKLFFDTSYKIYSCEMSHIISTIGIISKLIENARASYSIEEFGEGASVVGNEKTSLYFEYQISNLIQNFEDSEHRVKSVDVDFYLTYFVDDGTTEETNITETTEIDSTIKISSNDLIQTSSYYKNEDGTNIPLGEHILEEVRKRYSHGIECFEIECLFNNYYDEEGNVVFDGQDLSKHFKRYDIIIPYVKKNGKTVPLRVDEDGMPKKFRIIGISYSYDGLLKQKLSVQEERYDVD